MDARGGCGHVFARRRRGCAPRRWIARRGPERDNAMSKPRSGPVRRAKHGALRQSQPSGGDKLLRFLTQLAVLAVWKSLTTLSTPVARVIACYIWAGRSALKLAVWANRLTLRLTGWLASPAFARSHWLRQWGNHYVPLDVRKWHVVAGEAADCW